MVNNREIQENGKLICDFLHLRILDKRAKKNPVYIVPFSTVRKLEYFYGCNPSITIDDEIRASETLFHSNWSWVMKVVERIKQIKLSYPDLADASHFFTFLDSITHSMPRADVEATYRACVEFINNYNKSCNI